MIAGHRVLNIVGFEKLGGSLMWQKSNSFRNLCCRKTFIKLTSLAIL